MRLLAPVVRLCSWMQAKADLQSLQNVVVILQDIHALLKSQPNPDPRTWLNKKAADLYFNGGQEEREEYKRTVRRFAQRSMEEDGM